MDPNIADQNMKKPVSFFLVEYDSFDHFGYLLAFLSFTPPFLVAIQTAIYFTLLACGQVLRSKSCQRAALVAGKLLLGQLLNELLNLALKNTLKQSRPIPSEFLHNYHYKDYGMPSSHSQFMAFLLASFPSLASQICRLLKVSLFLEAAIISASFIGTALIAYGRYKTFIYSSLIFLF